MAAIRNTFLIVAWFGIILPSCPCKVLALFGIDLHTSVSRLAAPEEVQITLKSPGPSGHPCHCDEEIAKCATLADPKESSPEPDEILASVFFPCWTDSLHSEDFGREPLIRPPPDAPAFPGYPGRSHLAVYRL